MLNTLRIFEDLSHHMDRQAAKKIAGVLGQMYEEILQTVTKKEFAELAQSLSALGEAQKKTEAAVEKLAEAQSRTEARLEALAEAESRTEARLEELAEAQVKVEGRLGSLEVAVEKLAEAQKKTEISLNRLITEHGETRERLENMSDAVGYTLENHSYKGLPPLLKRDLGIEVEGRLLRRYLPGDKKGRYLQVNIYGWGRKNKHKVLILGEAKTS
ncbi:MAG: hypothetical protein JRI41_02255, partial [Deltaproteobacteria bacterium]|nr:hypothetical protein [Deltaproteobacteria bacterium]